MLQNSWNCYVMLNVGFNTVRAAQQSLNWTAIEDESDCSWDVFWSDNSIGVDRLLRLHPAQVG